MLTHTDSKASRREQVIQMRQRVICCNAIPAIPSSQYSRRHVPLFLHISRLTYWTEVEELLLILWTEFQHELKLIYLIRSAAWYVLHLLYIALFVKNGSFVANRQCICYALTSFYLSKSLTLLFLKLARNRNHIGISIPMWILLLFFPMCLKWDLLKHILPSKSTIFANVLLKQYFIIFFNA